VQRGDCQKSEGYLMLTFLYVFESCVWSCGVEAELMRLYSDSILGAADNIGSNGHDASLSLHLWRSLCYIRCDYNLHHSLFSNSMSVRSLLCCASHLPPSSNIQVTSPIGNYRLNHSITKTPTRKAVPLLPVLIVLFDLLFAIAS
jgi:hypothetical protein